MAKFHVILMDELGDDFSVELESDNKYSAWNKVAAEYPESRVQYVRELIRYERGL